MCDRVDQLPFFPHGRDGHQPNSRGLYTHYEDSLLKVGWVYPQYKEFRLWHIYGVVFSLGNTSLEGPFSNPFKPLALRLNQSQLHRLTQHPQRRSDMVRKRCAQWEKIEVITVPWGSNHLLRMVMEPKYFAFRRWLDTLIILWRSVIGSLGVRRGIYFPGNKHIPLLFGTFGTWPMIFRTSPAAWVCITEGWRGATPNIPLRYHVKSTLVRLKNCACMLTYGQGMAGVLPHKKNWIFRQKLTKRHD